MAEIQQWDPTAINNSDPPPNGWPENTMQYNEVNDTAREGMAVMARFYRNINGSLIAGGIANVYTLTLNGTYTAYFAGMYFACQINTENTGAATLNVNSLGAKSIINRDGSNLTPSTLRAGGIYDFRYDGTNIQLMGAVSGGTPSFAGVNVRTDIVTATPPTTEAVSGKYYFFDNDSTDELGSMGFTASNALTVRNLMRGGNMHFTVQNAAGFPRTPIVLNADVASEYINEFGHTFKVGVANDFGYSMTSTAHQFRINNAIAVKFNAGSHTFLGTAVNPPSAVEIVIASGSGALQSTIKHTAGHVLHLTNTYGGVIITGTSVTPTDILNSTVLTTTLTGRDTVAIQTNLDASSWRLTSTTATLKTGTLKALEHANGETAVHSTNDLAATHSRILFKRQNGTLRSLFGHDTSDSVVLRGEVNSASVSVQARNAIGVLRTGFNMDPVGATDIAASTDINVYVNSDATQYLAVKATALSGVELYAPTGIKRLATSATNALDVHGDSDLVAGYPLINLKSATVGTPLGWLGYGGGIGDLFLVNDVGDGKLTLRAERSIGGNLDVLDCDPQSDTYLRGVLDVKINLLTNTYVQLKQTGLSGVASGVEVRGPDGSMRPAGFNTLPRAGDFVTGNVTLDRQRIGQMYFYDTATARSLLLNNDATIPVDAAWALLVGPTGGTLTLDGGAGVTLTYWNGTSWTTTAAAGNLTAGAGHYTIWKNTDTNYYVTGPNLS